MDGYQPIRATKRPSDTGQQSPGSCEPYRRLAAAVLGQAAKEARAGDPDAAIWLLSEQAELLAGGIGLSFAHVKAWARARANGYNKQHERKESGDDYEEINSL